MFIDIRICIRTYVVLKAVSSHQKYIYTYAQPIPRGVTFSKALSKLKSQSSNVSFHWNVAKETFELWALSFETAFENVTPRGIGCTYIYVYTSHVYIYVYMYLYICICIRTPSWGLPVVYRHIYMYTLQWYGVATISWLHQIIVATISWLHQIIGLFCKRAL